MPPFDFDTEFVSRLKSNSEMKSIKPLPENVRNSMRSGIILFDITRVVEELVFNSLDAGATKISIFLGVVTCYVKVVDDGCGISREDLVLLGERYATSKLQDFADLEAASGSFGFRGEALASISDISLLEIATKAIGRPNGYRKVMKGSKCVYLGIDDDCKGVGTIVVVRDLFYNQPVRRKHMQTSPKKVLQSVKNCVFWIALVHANVSFNIIDVESDLELLRVNSSSSRLSFLMDSFGIEDLTSLLKVNASDGSQKISGYISSPGDCFGIKAFQLVYINSRLVSKSSIHKLINQLPGSFDCPTPWKSSGPHQKGKRSRLQANPTYILNLACPRCLYDLTFEPSKTHVEFKDWEPILAFTEKVIRALWKKDTTSESVDEVDNILGKDEIHEVADNISIEEDFSEILEFTRKKRRRQNHQTSSHLLYSPSDDLNRYRGYCKESDERTPYFEFKRETEDTNKPDIEVELFQNHKRSNDSVMQKNEDFPWKFCADDFMEISRPPYVDHSFRKQSEAMCYDFNESDNEMDKNYGIRKQFLQSCTSRGRLPLDDPIIPLKEGFESFTDVFKTRQKGAFSDIQEVHATTMSSNFSPGTSKQDEALFGLQHLRHGRRGEIEADFDTLSKDPAELFPSCEEHFMTEKFVSAAQVENSDGDYWSSGSEWRHVTCDPLSETMRDSDDNLFSTELGGSIRWQTRPNYWNFADEEDYNFNFDDDIMPETHGQGNHTAGCIDAVFDVNDHTDSDEGFSKFLQRDSVHDVLHQESYNLLADDMVQNLRHANYEGSDWCKNQREEFKYQDYRQNHVPEERQRRSHSAPPFYRQQKRFISLSNCSVINSENSNSHGSYYTKVADDLKYHQQSSGASHVHLAANFTEDIRCEVRQNMKNKLDFASETKSSMECQGSLHLQPQEDARDIDFISEEDQDPVNYISKWRHNFPVAMIKASEELHEVQDQHIILDLSSGFLQHLDGESLVPESMNRNFLEDAKVLQQVDKKFIPIVAGGILAIIDQHAADERIRLEELRRKVLAKEGKTITYLDAEQELTLPEMGCQLLQSYAEQIKDWGWICNINVQGSNSFKKNMSVLNRQPTLVTLHAVPCILGVNLSDADLMEFLQQLADTDGSSTIPPSVLRILNSKACRGAIMFGDSLLPSECSLIVEELKQTSLCFQCAHGRPTTVPLVDMKALHKQITKLSSDQLWRGLRRHEISLNRTRMRLRSARG